MRKMSRFKIFNPAPVVDYRFGDIYYTTDFIQPKNPAVLAEFTKLQASDPDMFVQNVARWIRSDSQITYPVDTEEFPTADGQLLRYKQSRHRWQFNSRRYYVWSFPAEVLVTKRGLEFDTSNLVTSILRAGLADAWTCLGLVKQIRGDILGNHAWVRVKYRGEQYICETIIHDEETNNLIRAAELYNKTSDFATRGEIYYVELAHYNEAMYAEIPGWQQSLPNEVPLSEVQQGELTPLQGISQQMPVDVLQEIRASTQLIPKMYETLEYIRTAFKDHRLINERLSQIENELKNVAEEQRMSVQKILDVIKEQDVTSVTRMAKIIIKKQNFILENLDRQQAAQCKEIFNKLKGSLHHVGLNIVSVLLIELIKIVLGVPDGASILSTISGHF